MDYLEITFHPLAEEQKEILMALLGEVGFDSFREEDDHIKGYIPAKLFDDSEVSSLIASLPSFEEMTYSVSTLPNINWNEEWEKNFQPVLVEDKVYIRADFHAPIDTVEHDVVINPKMSFGTGHHATTYMMVATMQEMDLRDKKVLDFGCGSGVLAILAQKMHANSTVAVDHEEWAYKNAMENVAINGVEHVTVIQGDEQAIPDEKYDVILANVNRNVLENSLLLLAERLVNGGIVLLSGLLEEDEATIVEKGVKCGLDFDSKKAKNGWICIKLVTDQ